jgi:BlaI family transcriptional regulator, penicillinase repressor
MIHTMETPSDPNTLSRRERQILDLLFRLGPMTVTQTRSAIPDPPTYSGVRALLQILVTKGHVTYDQIGREYVYRPIQSSTLAAEKAISHLIATYFQGSPSELLAAVLAMRGARFSREELIHVREFVDNAISHCSHEPLDR